MITITITLTLTKTIIPIIITLHKFYFQVGLPGSPRESDVVRSDADRCRLPPHGARYVRADHVLHQHAVLRHGRLRLTLQRFLPRRSLHSAGRRHAH